MRMTIRDDMQRNIGSFVLAGLCLVAGLILWETAVRRHWVVPSSAAAPSAVWFILGEDLELILRNLSASLARLGVGVLTGLLAGAVSGLLSARVVVFRKTWGNLVRFLAPIPVIVWIPFAVMFFGHPEMEKVSLVALATFFIVHIGVTEAVREIPKQHLEVVRIYEKSRSYRIRYIYFPACVSAIATVFRIALALSWIVLFIVEFGNSSSQFSGLGYYIADNRSLGKTEQYFAGVIVLAFAAFAIDLCVSSGSRRLLRWRQGELLHD